MSAPRHFLQRHPLALFLFLTFSISWAAVLLAAGTGGLPATPDNQAVLGMAILLGPTLAGLIATGIVQGKQGFRTLLARLVHVRVGVRWYAVALLTAPVATLGALLLLSPSSPSFTPAFITATDKGGLVVMGVVAGVMVGLFEELGWTGFAAPAFRARYGVVASGLLIGVAWGLWHLPLFWEPHVFTEGLPLALLLARLLSWLPAYRVLMVWLHDRTQSLFVTILMHVSLVASTILLEPALEGVPLLAYILVRAAFFWLLAAWIAYSLRRTARQVAPALEEV